VADIVIIGGGPAGSAAAGLLAAWGHSVLLLTKHLESASLAESIPPSTRKLFDAFGFTDAIERAAFQRWRGNVVSWGRERRLESFPSDVWGHHVVRAEFDRLLRRIAAERGASIEHVTVTGATIDEQNGHARLQIDAADPPPGFDAPFILDCSGRASVLARAFRLRKLETAPRTIALAAVWTRSGGWDDLDDTYTFVETHPDGWLWSVPVSAERRYVTVMIDPQTTNLERGSGADGVYRNELNKASVFQSKLAGAHLIEGPWGFDASQYTSQSFYGPNFLLAGDAASSLDPLSSFGVKKALASAWLAAVVAHTWLERPAMRAVASEFFASRERELYAASRRPSRDFSAAAADAHGHPFWLTRGHPAADADEPSDPVERLRTDPGVLRAFADIRAAPRLAVQRGARAMIERRPAISGREIVMLPCLVTATFPEGIRFLRGVDLLHLIDLAPAHADVGALFDAYSRSAAPVDLPDFLGTLAALVSWRVLERVNP
jgi:flavin-dependent dehydrogenase